MDIASLNERFECASTEEILRWAWETLAPDVAASSSFQTQSVPLLHIISQVCPEMPVIFIDTGFHFPETLTFRDKLQAQFNLNILTVRPTMTQSELLQQYGEALYRHDPDLCCYINKVSPMQWITERLKALVAGVRRDQTANRQTMSVLQQPSKGPLQIRPMLNWTRDDVQAYRRTHDLPVHPLYHRGYVSVGCAPCTRPVSLDEGERAGRWIESDKQECGLHLDWDEEGKKHGQ